MGTNFYMLKKATGLQSNHIGKRSAAGMYCWDCNQSLCKTGNNGVHQGKSEWHSSCPKCGKKFIEEDFNNSSAGRELGFNKSKPKAKKGVASCSSFRWAIDPEEFLKSKIKVIKDEYGQKFTREEFEQILLECPIQYNESIGQAFS